MLKRQGVTLLELLLVIVIIGIIAVSIPRTRPDKAQAEQAASNLIRLVQRTRYEAITSNRFVGLHIDTTGYRIFVACATIDFNCNSARYNSPGTSPIISRVLVGTGSEYPLLNLTVPSSTNQIIFNPRGLVVNTAELAATPVTVRFTSRRNANTFTQVRVTQQGQAQKF